MVRIKKRYMVLQLEPRSSVTRWCFSNSPLPTLALDNTDLGQINERQIVRTINDLALEMFGEVGTAQLAGLRVVYVNKLSGLVLMTAHHGKPFDRMAALVPLLDRVGDVGIVARLVYTGATVNNCYKRMDAFQCEQLRRLQLHLGRSESEQDRKEADELARRMKELRRVDNMW